MIVTCPKCEARYAVDPLAIGPSGRTVQCARCSNQWLQKVEGAPPAPDLVIRPPSTDSGALPVPAAAKPEPASSNWLAVALVVVLIGAAGAGAYYYRDTLPGLRDSLVARVRNIPNLLKTFQSGGDNGPPAATASSATPAPTPAASPATAPASAAATPTTATPAASAPAPSTPAAAPKIDPPVAPAQLEVDLSASKIDLVDGRYVMRGEIANHGGSPGTTSKLTVVFKKGSDVLSTKTYPLTVGPIAPAGRQAFSQALDNPPPGATDIVPSVE